MLNGNFTINPWTKNRARELRKESTPAERRIWKYIRAHRFHGFKFRRQVALGRYIVDFLCEEKKLIIEIDGDVHWESTQIAYDQVSENFLKSHGYGVLRFGNNMIMTNIDGVLERLAEVMDIKYS